MENRISTRYLLPALLAATLGIALPVASPVLAAQSATTAGDTDALMAQAVAWDEAIVRKRRAAIEANMAPEFLHIGEDGALSNRAGFLDAILSEHLAIEPYAMDDVQVRVFGDAALLTGTTRMRGAWRGKPFSSHYRFTDTYVRRDGAWRVVQVQITALPRD